MTNPRIIPERTLIIFEVYSPCVMRGSKEFTRTMISEMNMDRAIKFILLYYGYGVRVKTRNCKNNGRRNTNVLFPISSIQLPVNFELINCQFEFDSDSLSQLADWVNRY